MRLPYVECWSAYVVNDIDKRLFQLWARFQARRFFILRTIKLLRDLWDASNVIPKNWCGHHSTTIDHNTLSTHTQRTSDKSPILVWWVIPSRGHEDFTHSLPKQLVFLPQFRSKHSVDICYTLRQGTIHTTRYLTQAAFLHLHSHPLSQDNLYKTHRSVFFILNLKLILCCRHLNFFMTPLVKIMFSKCNCNCLKLLWEVIFKDCLTSL